MIAKEIMSSNFISIEQDEPISRLIGKFRQSKMTEAVVLAKGKYAGVVGKRKSLKSRLNADKAKVKNLVLHVAVLDGKEEIAKVAELMNSSDVHMLPVVKNGTVEGVVYALDVISQLPDIAREKRISDVMSAKVVSFDENTGVSKAMSVMHLQKIDRAPVVDKHGRVIGVVSVVDLMLKYSIFPPRRAGGKNLKEPTDSPGKPRELSLLPVINEATPNVTTAKKDDRVKLVVSLMESNRISDVIITDENQEPIGIITLKDLLRLFV